MVVVVVQLDIRNLVKSEFHQNFKRVRGYSSINNSCLFIHKMHNLFKSKTKTKNFSDAEIFFFCFSLFASVGWILFLVLFCRKIKLDHQYLKIARAYYQKKRIQSYRFGLFLNHTRLVSKNDSISNRKKQTSKWIYKHFSGITKHFRLFVRSDYLFITTIDSIFDVFCVYNPHIEIETNKQTQ